MSGVALGIDGAAGAVINASIIAKLLPFQPTTSRQFTSADTLKLFARLFWKSKDQPVVTLTIAGAGAPVTMTPTIKTQTVDGRQEAVLDTSVPLKSLAAGAYRLTIDARLSNRQSVSRVIPFEVK
jgi:hypothetical protein